VWTALRDARVSTVIKLIENNDGVHTTRESTRICTAPHSVYTYGPLPESEGGVGNTMKMYNDE